MDMFTDPQTNAAVGVHFQLDSICSEMSNESIGNCMDDYLPNMLGWPCETQVMQSVILCGYHHVRYTLMCFQ